VLWKEKSRINTQPTLQLAVKRVEELGLKHMVIASSSGYTVNCLLKLDPKSEIICVTHHVGFAGNGVDEMPAQMRSQLQNAGVNLLTTTHLFAGVDRAIRIKFAGVYPAEIMAQTLRIFGQGVKVAVEIAVMALDAGLIPFGSEVISIGGSGTGADTAIVVQPAHSNNFFDTQIKEILCWPREK
jgi:hypothetical protein